MPSVTEVSVQRTHAENRWSAEFYDMRLQNHYKAAVSWTPLGRLLSRTQYGLSRAMNDDRRGAPIYRMGELHGLFLGDAARYVEVSDSEFQHYRVDLDDLLFNRTNSTEFVGRTAIAKKNYQAVFASYLVRLRTRRDRLLPEFLVAYLNSAFGRKELRRRAMPSINQANISASELRRLPCPVLPIREQERIATLVNDAASRRDEARLSALRARTAIESELGLSSLDRSHTMDHASSLSMMQASGRWDAEYFEPRHLRLIDHLEGYARGAQPLLRLTQPVPLAGSPASNSGGTHQYVELADVDPDLLLVKRHERVAADELPGRARRLIRTGDVIVSAVAGSSDKVALVNSDYEGAFASNGFFQFRGGESDPAYVAALMSSTALRSQLERQATGGILSAVPHTRLRLVVAPNLPEKLQTVVATYIRTSHMNFAKSESLSSQAVAEVDSLLA